MKFLSVANECQKQFLFFCKRLMFEFLSYSRSSPCDHSRKQSGLVYTTTFVKTRLNCDLNFVMKSLGK